MARLSQEQLAEILDCAPNTLSYIESMTDTQLGITYKLLLNIANLCPNDLHKSVK